MSSKTEEELFSISKISSILILSVCKLYVKDYCSSSLLSWTRRSLFYLLRSVLSELDFTIFQDNLSTLVQIDFDNYSVSIFYDNKSVAKKQEHFRDSKLFKEFKKSKQDSTYYSCFKKIFKIEDFKSTQDKAIIVDNSKSKYSTSTDNIFEAVVIYIFAIVITSSDCCIFRDISADIRHKINTIISNILNLLTVLNRAFDVETRDNINNFLYRAYKDRLADLLNL